MNILRFFILFFILILGVSCIGIGIYMYFNPVGSNVPFLQQLSLLILILIVLLLLISWKLNKN